jgi:hypothetical protein
VCTRDAWLLAAVIGLLLAVNVVKLMVLLRQPAWEPAAEAPSTQVRAR